MKVSKTKAPSILKDLLSEKSRRLEIAWPQDAEHEIEQTAPIIASAPELPAVLEQPTILEQMAVEPPKPAAAEAEPIAEPIVVEQPRVEEIAAPIAVLPAETIEPVQTTAPAQEIVVKPIVVAPVAEVVAPIIIEAAAIETVPEMPVAVEVPVAEIAPSAPDVVAIALEKAVNEAVAEVSASEMSPPANDEAPAPAEAEAEAPSRPYKSPRMQDLLESDEWICGLTKRLIESDRASQEQNRAPVWKLLGQDTGGERYRAKVEALSERVAKEQASIPDEQLSGLKMKFLQAIRRVPEPYRSTLVRHYCEGMSVPELVEKLGIPGWIVRERLAAALAHLDGILDKELGKQKTKNYVLLAQLAKH